jgi:hypothetical protein
MYYTFVSKNSGKCLDVSGYSTANAASIQQWGCTGADNQRWTLVAMGDGSYEVIGKQSGKCLDVAGQSLANAANVQQYTCWGGKNQRWKLVSTGDGSNEVVAQNSGKCLDVAAQSTANGANIQQWTCWGGNNQRWKLTAIVAEPQPLGPSGTWTQTFGDEFNGTALDRAKWEPCWYYPTCKPMNDVSTSAANVSVGNGVATLTLPNSSSGALIDTDPHRGSTSPGFEFQYGAFEGRIWFPGNGTNCLDWPAWWTDGQARPGGGENDIAEVLDGYMTVNYHSVFGDYNQGSVPGYWCGGFHTYTLDREAGHAYVYFDGTLVKNYATNDGGALEYLILTIGQGGVVSYPAQLKIDYVRAWRH